MHIGPDLGLQGHQPCRASLVTSAGKKWSENTVHFASLTDLCHLKRRQMHTGTNFRRETLLRDYKGHQALFIEQGAFAFARCRSKTHGRNVLSAWQGWRVDCFHICCGCPKESVFKCDQNNHRRRPPRAAHCWCSRDE